MLLSAAQETLSRFVVAEEGSGLIMSDALRLDDDGKLRLSLLIHLANKGIRFSKMMNKDMKDKAVVEFCLDMSIAPCILYGAFEDKIREIATLAHEAGHVLMYQGMDRDEAQTYISTMLAMHGMGLDQISAKAQEFILTVESGASATGFEILGEIGVNSRDLGKVAKMLAEWYGNYEALCDEQLVKKIREKLRKDKHTAFLVP